MRGEAVERSASGGAVALNAMEPGHYEAGDEPLSTPPHEAADRAHRQRAQGGDGTAGGDRGEGGDRGVSQRALTGDRLRSIDAPHLTSDMLMALPGELFERVAAELSLEQRCAASLVCRAWKRRLWRSVTKLSLRRRRAVLEAYCLRPLLLRCPALQYLECPPETSDADVQELCIAAPALTTLGLRRAKCVTDDALLAVGRLARLERLYLSASWNITSAGIALLAPLASSLRTLELRGCDRVDDNALEVLSCFSALEHLDLRDCVLVTDDGLKYLCGCGLRSLDLSGTSVSDFGVRRVVSSNPTLHSLQLWGCDITDASAVTIARHLRLLAVLDVYECHRLTNAALKAIALISSLRVLHASSAGFTHSGVPHLAQLKMLDEVSIGASLTHAVAAESLFPNARRACVRNYA